MTTRLTLCLSAFLACGVAFPANAYDEVDTSYCNPVLEIAQYYSGYHAVAYKFEDDDATRIIGFLTHILGPMPIRDDGSRATIVWIGLNATEQSGDFFFYDAKNCFVNSTRYWLPEDILSLLEALDITAPFGSTYHQLPGTPGARAGTSI